MLTLKRIAVFCGSSSGYSDHIISKANKLGAFLATKNIELVYGGAKLGVMGAVANGALKNNGLVTGIIPEFLCFKEIVHDGLTNLHVVQSMHERKTMMNHRADGFITLPGGFGTMEEFFEMLTWAQLGLHQKPVAIYNVDGFFDSLLAFLQEMVDKGFLKEENIKMLIVSDSMEDLLEKMKNYKAPKMDKWLDIDSKV